MLKIRVLQTPSIELDGEPVSLPFKRAEALLYYLVVRRSASRQELIALLWEGDNEAKGLKNLRHTLYVLKKALGGEVLLSPQKSMIVLNPQWELESDYERFVHGGDFEAYHGPFLSGFSVRSAFAFDEWVQRTREKLRSQYLYGLEQQAAAARLGGEPEKAEQLARTYLEEEPFDETMAAFLMECLKDRRQFARAVQVYQRLKEALSGEMGVDPLESTTLLYYEILNLWNDMAKTPDGRTAAVPVGRERIYNVLRASAAAFAEMSSRRSSLLLVGETGSGKSELLNYFQQAQEFPELTVIRTECLQSENREPLAVWGRILRPLQEIIWTEQIAVPEQVSERLRKSFPLFRGGRERLNERMPYDQNLEDSVLLLFSLAGRRRKLLLVLEDLQWIDVQSMQLLNALLRHLERGSLMAVLSSTWGFAQETKSVLEELERDGLLHRQTLQPLSQADTSELLRRELGQQAAQTLAEQFYRETGGNLSLLTVLTETYRQSGDLDATMRTMGEVLLKRLDGLPDDALRVTQWLSLFPDGVPSSLLPELMGQGERQLSDILLDLRCRTILEEYALHGVMCCRFVHQKLRELAYDRMTAYQRRELHRKAADVLRSKADVTNEQICREIARHYDLARDLRQTLDFRLRALELETVRRCEPFHPAEKNLPERTVQALEEDADGCQRELAALSRAGCEDGELTQMERRMTLIRGRIALFRGDAESGGELLGALSEAGSGRDSAQMAKICILLADAAYYRQEADRAERYVSTGMRLLEREQDDLLLARLYRLRGSCFGLQGDYDRAGYYLQEARELLEKLEPSAEVRGVLAAVFGDLGRSARCRNDFIHAGKWFKKAMGLLKDTQCAGQVWLYVHYGRTVFAVDDYVRARELFRTAYDLAERSSELWGKTAAAAYCAYFEMTDGDYEQAAQTLREAMACAEQMHSPLESGILNFVCMKIRRRLDLEQRTDSPLQVLLPDTADDYARRGVRLCSGVPDVFEMQMLSKDLRDGISSQLRYRSSELYSKNKRFMSE